MNQYGSQNGSNNTAQHYMNPNVYYPQTYNNHIQAPQQQHHEQHHVEQQHHHHTQHQYQQQHQNQHHTQNHQQSVSSQQARYHQHQLPSSNARSNNVLQGALQSLRTQTLQSQQHMIQQTHHQQQQPQQPQHDHLYQTSNFRSQAYLGLNQPSTLHTQTTQYQLPHHSTNHAQNSHQLFNESTSVRNTSSQQANALIPNSGINSLSIPGNTNNNPSPKNNMTGQAAYTNTVNNMYSRNVPASHSVSYAQKNSPQQHSQNSTQQSIQNFPSSTSILVAYLNKQNNTAVTNNSPPPHGSVDNPLTKFTLSIPSLSLTPLTGQDVVTNVKKSCSCVSSNYLPCVDFLVTCQQDLRTGLAVATGKKTNGKGRSSRAEAMNGTQFYAKYIGPLPHKFTSLYSKIIPYQDLTKAHLELQHLCQQSYDQEKNGCEQVKNTFLGGMRDGESWGLRKWLSKNGGALKTCSDLELIFQAVQKMDRDESNTIILAKRIRPIASDALTKLRKLVPQAYQEISTAHPYLPFFHRLESALQSLATYDPEDDDVIIIEDVDEIKPKNKQTIPNNINNINNTKTTNVSDRSQPGINSRKRDRTEFSNNGGSMTNRLPEEIKRVQRTSNNGNSIYDILHSRQPVGNSFTNNNFDLNLSSIQSSGYANFNMNSNTNGTSHSHDQNIFPQDSAASDDDFCEIVCVKKGDSQTSDVYHSAAARGESSEDVGGGGPNSVPANSSTQPSSSVSSVVKEENHYQGDTNMADQLDILASRFCGEVQTNRYELFWNNNPNFACILGWFSALLRDERSIHLIDPVESTKYPDYTDIIINPLCFRDIYNTIIYSYNSGVSINANNVNGGSSIRSYLSPAFLNDTNLSWDMWDGLDLLQALDLVLLNYLAYFGRQKNAYRKGVVELRESFWSDIVTKVGARNKDQIPKKRSETSSFVIFK